MNQSANKVNLETAIAIICEIYHLDAKAFSDILEKLGCISPEQRDTAIAISSAFIMKEMFDNQTFK